MINGTVYKITNTNTGECYIGSTCIHIEVRLYQHRINSTRAKKSSSHKLFIDPTHNIIIEALEEGTYATRHDLNIREYQYMAKYPTAVNLKRHPFLDSKTYYQDNKDIYRKRCRERQRRLRKHCVYCCTDICPNSWEYHLNSRKHIRNFISY